MSGRGWVVVGVGGFWVLVAGGLIDNLNLMGVAFVMMLVAGIALSFEDRDR